MGIRKQKDTSVLSAFPEYKIVRNLQVLSGRFFDEEKGTSRRGTKVGVINRQSAQQTNGSTEEAVGKRPIIGLRS